MSYYIIVAHFASEKDIIVTIIPFSYFYFSEP